MAFNWGDYLTLAKQIQSTTGSLQEAAQRTAVSRAYYAAYGHARQYAISKLEFTSPRENPHKALIDHYKAKGYLQISIILFNLRNNRQNCDYEKTVTGLDTKTAQTIAAAETVLNSLK